MVKKDKTPLECMFNNLDDISAGTDEEVEQELRELGIDINGAYYKLMDKFSALKSKRAK